MTYSITTTLVGRAADTTSIPTTSVGRHIPIKLVGTVHFDKSCIMHAAAAAEKKQIRGGVGGGWVGGFG